MAAPQIKQQMKNQQITKGTKISFTDKYGHQLTGTVTETHYEGNPNIIVANCFKPSWDMFVNCVVRKKNVKIVA